MGKTINQYEAEHPAHIIDIARCLMPIAWTAECHTALRDASIRMAERMDLAIPDYLYRHYSEIGAMRARVEMEQQRRARESSPAYLLRALWRALLGRSPKRLTCHHAVLWDDCPDCSH
jgi:hypothetical protein